MLKAATLKVQGLNSNKLRLISDFFSRDFICIQETMISDELLQSTLMREWNGPSYWSPVIGRRGGVAILCSPCQRDNISVWQKDAGGHLVSLLLSINGMRINLVNIYTPTYPMERKNFFQSLVLAGHFNCYDSAMDKMGGSASIDPSLSELISVHALRDAWRLKHHRDRQFTWFNSNLSIASGLDSFLISRYLCEQVVSCEIYPCVYVVV